MRPFFFVSGNGRKPQSIRKVVPSELVVLKLRDRVSQKDQHAKNIECLQELTMALTCLKTYNFHEGSCENEIKSMQQCFLEHSNKKSQERVGKRVPSQVAKKLLDRYPNI